MEYNSTASEHMIVLSFTEYTRVRRLYPAETQIADDFEHHLGLLFADDINRDYIARGMQFCVINHQAFQTAILRYSIQHELP